MWNQYYNAMVEFIRSKKNKSPEEREDFCKKYQFFAHHLLSNQEFHEYYSLPENARYYPKPVGYYVEKGELYQKWEIRGYQNLFVLDIWELLFNPKAKCSLVQCEKCSQFFQTTTKNKHYCAECQQSINYAANYRNNPIHKLRKSILAKIEANKKYSNDEGDELLDRFGREYEYYYQIVNFGKTDLPQPEKYDPNIKTEETFLDWLKKWDDEVRVYNKRAKKNEKNRKLRIIHKFYLRKDYIQKIFNTRREKETEMETDIEDELIR